jgi:hypothetical protein
LLLLSLVLFLKLPGATIDLLQLRLGGLATTALLGDATLQAPHCRAVRLTSRHQPVQSAPQ